MSAEAYRKKGQKIQKRYSIPNLLKRAEEEFNLFIRTRDQGKPCISCGNWSTLQAGHYYPAGHSSILRFNEDNVHGQCCSCNLHKSGDLSNYRLNLERKIGKERLADLDNLHLMGKRGYKWDRFFLETLIQEYKAKNKKAG